MYYCYNLENQEVKTYCESYINKAISTNLAREEFYVKIYNSGKDHLSQTVYFAQIFIIVMFLKYLMTNMAHASTNTEGLDFGVALKWLRAVAIC